MAPTANKDDQSVSVKETSDNETDEGFHSPVVSRSGLRGENLPGPRVTEAEVGDCSSSTSSSSGGASDNDSQADSGSNAVSDVENEAQPNSGSSQSGPNSGDSGRRERDSVECQAQSLAEYIVYTLTGKKNEQTKCPVERTMLRCVKNMMLKHEILLKGMMKRLDITRETGYVSFVAVANELFEGEKKAVTWGRIVALYAFGGQLSLYCKEKNMIDFCGKIAEFMGIYASEVVAPYVKKVGGWAKLCEEFPAEDNLESKAWRFLTWTALGLGLAATASFFTSH